MSFQMIKSKVGNIKSGWRSVFMIFTAAAADELESIIESAFENVEQGRQYSLSPSLSLLTLIFYISTVFNCTNACNCSYFGTL